MFFENVSEGPPDPIFGMGTIFRQDPRPNKIDLMVGIYRNEKLVPELLHVVKRAKEEIMAQDMMADYLPIDGLEALLHALGGLVFRNWKELEARVYAAQTVGGTAALRIGGEFVAQEVGGKIFVSHPTWPNHHSVMERAGCQVASYSYYSREKHGIDFDKMLEDLEGCPENSCILLHAACHNPTGSDPTEEQWRHLSQIMRKKKLLPFFDFAYQGLGSGIEEDRRAIEIFLEDGHEFLIAYSCSKNFSLYCQRVGALFVVTRDSKAKQQVGSQIKRIIRALYSNPPAHGARIPAHILQNATLGAAWKKELNTLRERTAKMRTLLVDQLPPHFSFLKEHKGMFSFMDLEKEQVKRLIEQYGIYLIDNGRISIPGLNQENVGRVANAIGTVCRL